MGTIYQKSKKYFIENNPILTCFLIIYVSIIASYSILIAFYVSILLSFMLIVTKMIFLINNAIFIKPIAFSLNILYSSTYITLIFMISNVLYPNQLKILIPSSILLLTNYIITVNLGISNKNNKLLFCLADGLIFFIIACVYVLFIGILNSISGILTIESLSILDLSIVTFFLNFIRIKFENLLQKRNQIIK